MNFIALSVLLATVITLTVQNRISRTVRQANDLDEKIEQLMQDDSNNDGRNELLGDYGVLIRDVINQLNSTIDTMAKNNPDELKQNLKQLAEIFDDLNEDYDAKTENGKMSKAFFDVFGSKFFVDYFNGIVSRLNGEQNDQGLITADKVFAFVKQVYVDWLEQFDKMVNGGQIDLAVESITECLEINMIYLAKLSRIELIEPINEVLLYKMKDGVIRHIAYLFMKMALLQ